MDGTNFLGAIVLLIAVLWLPFLLLRINGRLRDIHAASREPGAEAQGTGCG